MQCRKGSKDFVKVQHFCGDHNRERFLLTKTVSGRLNLDDLPQFHVAVGQN